MTEIPISEDFGNSRGEFLNYDTYVAADRTSLLGLKHVNIRTFHQNDTTVPLNVGELSNLAMGDLQGLQIGNLGSRVVGPRGEGWSSGSIVLDSAHRPGLQLSLTAGNTSESHSTVEAIDLLNGFANNDFISVALPSFPLAAVDQANSFIDFSTNDDNSFTQVASVALSASLTTLINGNTEFRVLRSAFNAIDLSQVRAVRFRIKGLASATIRIMAVRLLATTWVLPTVDIDTRYGLLSSGIATNGNPAAAATFTVPQIWRAEEPSGDEDPRPIDAEMGLIFNSGSAAGANTFSLFFREVTEDFFTQLDLDGSSMASLDGLPQPAVGDARYIARTQVDLEQFTQDELDGLTQFELERAPDSTSASWIEFKFSWGSTNQVILRNTESAGYTFSFSALTPNTLYAMFAKLEENSASVRIYPVINNNQADTSTVILDTTIVTDDFVFPRRKGRFGWSASFADGDVYIDSIRSRIINFAEFRSLPLRSNTPVTGASLFVSTSPNTQLFTDFLPGPYNDDTLSKVDIDRARSVSGQAFRVQDFGLANLQGLQSNIFYIHDFENSGIEFDIWYPQNGLNFGSRIVANLVYENRAAAISLLLPRLLGDQWQHIRIDFPFGPSTLNGYYQLSLMQDQIFTATWWVDNINIYERTIVWDGRAITDDPWYANQAVWTPFKNILNDENNGTLFADRGNELQIRARALRQSAHIDRMQFRPKYAELGRFVWPEDLI